MTRDIFDRKRQGESGERRKSGHFVIFRTFHLFRRRPARQQVLLLLLPKGLLEDGGLRAPQHLDTREQETCTLTQQSQSTLAAISRQRICPASNIPVELEGVLGYFVQ